MPARHHRYTYGEYLALEEHANVRHELLDGEIFAVAALTPRDPARLAKRRSDESRSGSPRFEGPDAGRLRAATWRLARIGRSCHDRAAAHTREAVQANEGTLLSRAAGG